jgi:eukaryotic-like serine/threonine-protein kinase
VIYVNWDDAKRYVAWLSKLTCKSYRLLTEAEWEYAARAGTTKIYSFGDDEAALGEYAWYGGNSKTQAHPVGEKKPNAFGLYDMHGNVWEWVDDPWHENYAGAPSDGSAWIEGGDTRFRILRGGSWNMGPGLLTSTFRNHILSKAVTRLSFYGFRVARTLDQ